jgi:hypothetical protein
LQSRKYFNKKSYFSGKKAGIKEKILFFTFSQTKRNDTCLVTAGQPGVTIAPIPMDLKTAEIPYSGTTGT